MENGCQLKYLSYAAALEDLTCPKGEVSRIWEDNLNLLVQDHDDMYGCVNQDCCTQVKALIAGRFNVVTVGCIVTMVYLLLFIVNQQYMLKVIQKYQIRFLNHNGDVGNLFLTLIFVGLFAFVKYGHTYEQLGPPIAEFQ